MPHSRQWKEFTFRIAAWYLISFISTDAWSSIWYFVRSQLLDQNLLSVSDKYHGFISIKSDYKSSKRCKYWCQNFVMNHDLGIMKMFVDDDNQGYRNTPSYFLHSADRSIKLSGSHRTQTQTSEVRWTARSSGHWVVASMFVIPKRPSKRQLRKTSNARRSQLNQYWSYKPQSNFKPTWIFLKILYVSFKWYFWQK